MSSIHRFAIRQFLRYSRITKGLTLGVRAVVFDGDRVFLVRHSYVPGWYLPGGGVEPGETAVEALARELEEESGLFPDGAPELFGLYLNRSLSTRDHVALFVCRNWTRVREPSVPNVEILEYGFFPLASLPEGTSEATRRRLAEIHGEMDRSPDW